MIKQINIADQLLFLFPDKGDFCQARLLLISAKISKFHSESLNSETKGAELTL